MEWVNENILPHWPFAVVLCVLWVIGHFMERSVFTKERLLEHHPIGYGKPRDKKAARKWKDPRSFGEKFHHWFFYWMRESMELHPILAGAVIGLIWQNPENAEPAWHWAASVGYFAGAGFLSLFGWLILSKVLGRVGIDTSTIKLPGESVPPPGRTGDG